MTLGVGEILMLIPLLILVLGGIAVVIYYRTKKSDPLE